MAAGLSLSCSPKVPNIKYCISKDENRGYCFFTITNEEIEVNGPEWKKLKLEGIILTSDGFGEISKYILEACREFNNCPEMEAKLEKLGLK